jgi:Putative phage metallopeptidase
VVLAWMLDTKRDVDGHLCLGKCVRASDLQKELADFDFVILLNKEVWESKEFGVERKSALLDHELMHIAEAVDKEGEPKFDSKGRKLFRMRGHDIEEFSAIVRRHGCYKKDLEHFAEALLSKSQAPLFAQQEATGGTAVVQ